MCKTLTYSQNRKCLICEKAIFGRSDKIYCGINCKNHYHSEVRKTTKTISAETIKLIHKNWKILASIMTEKGNQVTTKKVTLQRLGFNFDVATSVHTKFGFYNLGIFNYTYYVTKNDTVIILQNKDESEITPFLFKRLLLQFPLE
ncbi:MAG: hypothetical protein HYR91_14240 [Flavobacteriia bacterium]|nr:hypothetical protein [Flavobacteriia bacterium]